MPSKPRSLWESVTAAGGPCGRLHGLHATVALADLARGSSLGGRLDELRARSVLIAIKDPLAAALALIELDGVARRMVLSPPDLAAAHLPAVIQGAALDACVHEADAPPGPLPGIDRVVGIETTLRPGASARESSQATEWILLTSGTTGVPKLVRHDLASLTSALADAGPPPEPIVWSTFYDIRRYGGLQIYLRAVHVGSLVLADPAESVPDFLARAAAAGVTHISGTPSHWRRVLMSGAAAKIAPRYVRLSGEIADQAVLDALHAAYPQATVAHAFASTEAGVAFEVRDGRAGFPASLIEVPGSTVRLTIAGGTLHIRSPGNARDYLGEGAEALRGSDGAVDTGDRVEEREGRYYFLGRQGGVINVGGLKVYPEEIEAVINAHPLVRMSLVRARRNPITGAVVTADVVLADDPLGTERPAPEALARELLTSCRRSLAAYKVPASIRIVPRLEVSPSGKLVRPSA
ncbi:MAG TPA: fatty acid--CoA ligase family protein [Steroidobacteraceae bacterium]|nr:fatty acid--CoA ligase family protein [Steroidobacteraceae bacterium]